MAEPVRARRLTDEEGRRLQQIAAGQTRVGPGSASAESRMIRPGEESRRHAEGARHRLDQFHLRVGRLPVPQLPDGGVRDPLARGPLDQAGDLGVAAGAAADRTRLIDEPVHFVRQGAQGRPGLRTPGGLFRLGTPASTICAVGQGPGFRRGG
jgi:hypothetical protein